MGQVAAIKCGVNLFSNAHTPCELDAGHEGDHTYTFPGHFPVGISMENVDPIDQLHMMLAWEEDYTDEFKRKCLIEAIKEAMKGEGQ